MPYFALHNLGPKPFLPSAQRMLKEGAPLFPAMNIFDFEDKYVVELAVPGYDRNDIKVEVKEEALLIQGHHEEHPHPAAKVLQSDFTLREFRKLLQLDKLVDRKNISAHYENGMLTIHLPKVNESLDSKVRVIPID